MGGLTTEETLVDTHRLRAGDKTEFAALYRAFHGRVLGLCRRLLRSENESIRQALLIEEPSEQPAAARSERPRLLVSYKD